MAFYGLKNHKIRWIWLILPNTNARLKFFSSFFSSWLISLKYRFLLGFFLIFQPTTKESTWCKMKNWFIKYLFSRDQTALRWYVCTSRMNGMAINTIITCCMAYWHGQMTLQILIMQYHRICLQTFTTIAIGWRNGLSYTSDR